MEKWALIESTLPAQARSALDVGCNHGFFALRLARRGLFTLGVDGDQDLLRLAQTAAAEARISNAAFGRLQVDPDNIGDLPTSDVVLLLSVFHYWVLEHGWDTGVAMLEALWARSRMAMYFEMPNPCENSKLAGSLRRMGGTIQECEGFLRKVLEGLPQANVQLLAYLPTDFRGGERRHLFIVRRSSVQG